MVDGFQQIISTIFNKINSIIGLANDDNDHDESNKLEEEPTETPLPVDNKPFVLKKFRDALKKKDCITGIFRYISCNHIQMETF